MKHLLPVIVAAAFVYGCAKDSGTNPVTPSLYVGMERMVLIPAGTFWMGDSTGNGYSGERPFHQVTITRAFLMSRTEVTQAQWKAVMGANPSAFKGDSLPVENVSWYDAAAYCNRLSRKEGLDTCYTWSGTDYSCDFTANGYRLPTEAEWEYACRAGTRTDYHTGNGDWALDLAGWHVGNSGRETHPVGSKQPNAFGLYDMHGNVLEWCWDWYSSNYYTSNPATDPRGPATGSVRVLRGGMWAIGASNCRSAYRDCDPPVFRYNYCGFRVARSY